MKLNYTQSSRNVLFAAAAFISLFALAPAVEALEIKDAPVDIRNDFVLEPAKTEVILKPGAKTTRTLSVVNRTDREQLFNINIEDFEGSRDINQVIVLLGNDRGPYSLKDFIKPEVKSFKLKPKQRAILQVTIAIPEDAEPGGRYASVLVSTAATTGAPNEDESKAKTISRLGALYFVRVEGKVNEDGKLADFRLAGGKKSFYEKGPFNFELLFENNSSVHLTPSGRVEIKNMLGKKVKELDIIPFFSMPSSLRAAQVVWSGDLAFGRYTATAYIDRGYKESPDVTDVQSITFWVLPWKIMAGLAVATILVLIVLRTIYRSFEIKRKK
ncbi:MAG: DUF916 domain-containing protein [bacterium]|nr:DUF916 domain-containing protein [bacterium]